MVESGVRTDFLGREAGGLGGGVGIKCRTVDRSTARPKADATDLVRVGFAGDSVCAGAFWRAAAGEAGHCHVETSPKEMHRTGLANKAPAKLLEQSVGRLENSPETAYLHGSIRT